MFKSLSNYYLALLEAKGPAVGAGLNAVELYEAGVPPYRMRENYL